MAEDFNFEDYQPIDYRRWVLGDEARNGINIKRLGILTPDELKIWDAAVPFQDQRNDPGQGEIVTYFAIEFLKYLPGERSVAVPAAILHDVGWHGIDPDYWDNLVSAKAKEGGSAAMMAATDTEEQRRPHQNRGCLIAGKILQETGYFEKNSFESGREIADIIGDHDTRLLEPTESGRRVWASDFMWRVSYPLMDHSPALKDSSVEEVLERVEGTSLYCEPPKDMKGIELQIGKIEFVNSLLYKFGRDGVKDVLEPKYKKELAKMVAFYESD